MSRDATIPRWAAGVVVLAALLAGACGSGAIEGPADDTEAAEEQSDDDGGGGGGDGGGGGGGDYSWSLPVGDIDPDAAINLYKALRSSCDEGEAAVDEAEDDGSFPDELLQLYRAAIAICRGDVEGGRELYQGAGTSDDFVSACLVREAVLSVLDQRPQNISTCIGEEETTTSEEETTTTEGETTTPTEPGGDGDDGA